MEIPVELIKNHKELETEVLSRAREKGILKDSHCVRKVFVAPHGKLVNFVTK